MASKRHKSRQVSQAVQRSGSMTAVRPETKSWRSRTAGFMIRCRSAASTSASQRTLSSARAAKAAIRLVFPVPPLPLMMISSFIPISPPYV